MTKSYSNLSFSYLSLILNTPAASIERYLYRLITEGELQGRIDTVSGYFEKKKQANLLLKNEQ